MKLIRYGQLDKEIPGVVLDDIYYDVSAFAEDYNEQFFASEGLSRLEEFLKKNEGKLPEMPEGSRIGSPIARPSKIICIGLNYKDHANETGAALPSEPIVFMKATTALAGPFDNILIPR